MTRVDQCAQYLAELADFDIRVLLPDVGTHAAGAVEPTYCAEDEPFEARGRGKAAVLDDGRRGRWGVLLLLLRRWGGRRGN